MEIYGVTMNGVSVYNASAIGGHCHEDIEKYLSEALSMIELDTATTFARKKVDMGRAIGVNHLVATNENSVIRYAVRGNRAGATRFVMNQNAEETSILNVILCVATAEGEFNGKWVVVTAFAGEQGEREPWDASFKTEEAKAKAEAFWACHALVPTDAERALIG